MNDKKIKLGRFHKRVIETALENPEKLSPWQRNFVESIKDLEEVTEKQLHKINELTQGLSSK